MEPASNLPSPLAIQEILHTFPHLDRHMAETLLMMHERGRLSELVDKNAKVSQVHDKVHDNLQEDHFIKRGAIIVTENISP